MKYKVLVAEPIYSALRPDVYFNRLHFWKAAWGWEPSPHPMRWVRGNGEVTPDDFQYTARTTVMGPRRGIRDARDRAIAMAIAEGATHLFFLDDDILVPPQILTELLLCDKPIVGGLMHRDDGHPGTPRPRQEVMKMKTTAYPGFSILLIDDEPAWLKSFSLTLKSCAGINNVLMCQDSRQVMGLLDRRSAMA